MMSCPGISLLIASAAMMQGLVVLSKMPPLRRQPSSILANHSRIQEYPSFSGDVPFNAGFHEPQLDEGRGTQKQEP